MRFYILLSVVNVQNLSVNVEMRNKLRFILLLGVNLSIKKLRKDCLEAISRCNGVEYPAEDYVSLLNSSRDKPFMNCLLNIIESNSLSLRTKYIIVKTTSCCHIV